jgi:membrane associated rhomboid family serine protease
MIPLYDTIRARRIPFVNFILIALNVLAFLYEVRLGPAGLGRLMETWALIPARLIASPETAWVTIFTSMFMHGGWLHILSNMWVLFIFGDNVEDRMGGVRYFFFYLLSGVAAAALQIFLLRGSSQPMVGASGAIAGVLGAYLVLYPRAKVASLVPIFFIFTIVEIPASIFLLFWFILQLLSGFFAMQGGPSGIAWWAHVGGFLFGVVGAPFFAQRRLYTSF